MSLGCNGGLQSWLTRPKPFDGISNSLVSSPANPLVRPSQSRVEVPLLLSLSRRFLYFCIVVTYHQAKAAGNKVFTDSMEGKTSFWSSGGPYLHQPILKSLARDIAGFKLPPKITVSTFTDPIIPESDAEMAGEVTAVSVCEAAVESFRKETRQDKK